MVLVYGAYFHGELRIPQAAYKGWRRAALDEYHFKGWGPLESPQEGALSGTVGDALDDLCSSYHEVKVAYEEGILRVAGQITCESDYHIYVPSLLMAIRIAGEFGGEGKMTVVIVDMIGDPGCIEVGKFARGKTSLVRIASSDEERAAAEAVGLRHEGARSAKPRAKGRPKKAPKRRRTNERSR